MARVLTDNRNRTVSELRFLFSKHGGNLGEANSVGWMFQKRGIVHVDKTGVDEDRVMRLRSRPAPTTFPMPANTFEVVAAPESLDGVRAGIEGGGFKITAPR